MSEAVPHPPIQSVAADTDPVPASVRVQILATEHWSLLATRGMTWSEIMSRISIHLTIASASLVVLALVVQSSGFGAAFDVMSIGLAAATLVFGTLTSVRVHNASSDDAALVAGMNRLRAAYLEIDPTIGRYLVTSAHDDMDGVSSTYSMGMPRSLVSHVIGSTNFFVAVVNGVVAGTLGALVAHASGAAMPVISLVGAVAGLSYLVVVMDVVRRSFGKGPFDVRFPTPAG